MYLICELVYLLFLNVILVLLCVRYLIVLFIIVLDIPIKKNLFIILLPVYYYKYICSCDFFYLLIYIISTIACELMHVSTNEIVRVSLDGTVYVRYSQEIARNK